MRAVVALVLLASLGLAAPAHADTWAANDRRGDVTSVSFDLDAPPSDDCAAPPEQRVRGDARRDLLRLGIDHGPDAVTVTLTMRNVGRGDTQTGYDVHLQTDQKDYWLSLHRFEKGDDLEAFLSLEPDYPEPGTTEGCTYVIVTMGRACDGLLVDADPVTDRITATLPRTCLGRPAWVKVGAQAYAVRGTPDTTITSLSDAWSRRGETGEGSLPPFGPKVRR